MDDNTDFSLCGLDELHLFLQEQLGMDNLEQVEALVQQQVDLMFPPKVKSGLRKAKKKIFESMCREVGVNFKPSLRECWKELESAWKVMADCAIEDQKVPRLKTVAKIAEQHLRKIAMAQYEGDKGVPWACLH